VSGVVGVVAAMPEELAAVLDEVEVARVEEHGGRRFCVGRLHGCEVVAVVSRVGKVAAAATTALLIERYGVGEVLFTGVAGAVSAGLKVGDVVVATRLLQHDLDARPIFPRYEIPLLGVAEIATDVEVTERVAAAARAHAGEGRVHVGMVVSGDQFFASTAAIAELRARLPEALAVEMEGAAVAQVCFEMGVRCAVVRTISDAGDDSAAHDFGHFLTNVCGVYARAIVRGALEGRGKS
jgi:adenosylhomocysteine nucleosidase